MSYKKLTIWQKARELVIDIHKMTLRNLPKFELYEEGSQIRRSIKSVKSNIVEGYGRRRYKQEFIHFYPMELLLYTLVQMGGGVYHLDIIQIILLEEW